MLIQINKKEIKEGIIKPQNVKVKIGNEDIGKQMNYLRIEGFADDVIYYNIGFVRDSMYKRIKTWLFWNVYYKIKRMFG